MSGTAIAIVILVVGVIAAAMIYLTRKDPKPKPDPEADKKAIGTYTFEQNADYGYYNIGLAWGTVDDMKRTCTKLASCLGFNTAGWMKNTLKDKRTDYGGTDATYGFYTKV